MFRTLLRFTPAAGIILLASTGNAAVKITPALQKGPSDYFTCRVLNAGSKQLTGVTLRILDNNGAVLSQATVDPLPGATSSVPFLGSDTIGYCKLEGPFSRKRALLTFCAARSGETICETTVGDPGL